MNLAAGFTAFFLIMSAVFVSPHVEWEVARLATLILIIAALVAFFIGLFSDC